MIYFCDTKKKKVEERKKERREEMKKGKRKRENLHIYHPMVGCVTLLWIWVFVNCVSHGKSLKRVSQGRKFLVLDKGLNSLEDYLRGLF